MRPCVKLVAAGTRSSSLQVPFLPGMFKAALAEVDEESQGLRKPWQEQHWGM